MQNFRPPPSVQPPRRLLVLGAASLVGRFLLPDLERGGASLQAVSRRERPAGVGEASGGVAWRRADLTDPRLPERLAPADAAFSLSPIWLLPEVVPALASLGVRRLVAFSSTSRLTKIASTLAEERATAERLARGEDETARLCDELGIAWTILRPTLIYAEGQDANVSRLARLIRRFGVLPLAGRGEGLRQPVHAQDLATGALAALDEPRSFGRVYNLPGGETLSYRAMVARVFEGLGRRPRIVTVPPLLWRAALTVAAPLLPGATTAMGDRMSSDLVFDPAPAARDLGWSPRAFRPDFRRG